MSCDSTYMMARGEGRSFNVLISIEGSAVDITGFSIFGYLRSSSGAVTLTKRSPAAGGSNSEIEILNQVTNAGEAVTKITSIDTLSATPGIYTLETWIEVGGVPERIASTRIVIQTGARG